MFEKEIKILGVDKDELIEKLKKFGAKKTFEGDICDTYYDFVDGEKHKMEGNKRLFRIREKGSCFIYTIKKKEKSKKIKICQEEENDITSLPGFKKTLEKYGLKPTREKQKHRISYSLDSVEFDIDKYKDIPTFLEIEAENEEIINDWIVKLGLESNVKKKFGSRKLFEYYQVPYKTFKN